MPDFPTNGSITSELEYEKLGEDLEKKERSAGRKEQGGRRRAECWHSLSDRMEGGEEAGEERTDLGGPSELMS